MVNSKKLALSLGILSIIATSCICMQYRITKAANLDETIYLTDTNLKKSVLQWKEKCSEANEKLDKSNKDLEQLRKRVADIQVNEELNKKIEKYEDILGLTNVKGQGVIVTLADKLKLEYQLS